MRTINKITAKLKWALLAMTPVIMGTAPLPVPLPAPTGSHSIAICASGSLIGFGNNNSCQMGNGSTSSTVDPPVAASTLTNVVATSTGGGHSLALKDDGSVWVWGFNNQGQSAQSGTGDVCTPTEVGSLGCAVAVSAGAAFSMALMADGTIYTWGSNSNGQLGSGSMSPSTRYTPALVIGITNAIAISAGYNHAMALLDDGTVKVWGNGYYGQIGNSTSGSTASNNPTPISPTLTGIVRIEAGGSHNLALQNSGKLYVWGYNLKGQLGLGDYTDRTVPTSSSISSGTIVDMAAGINHTIILNSNGTLRVCGNSVKRELGICSGGTYNTGQNGPTISGIVDVQTSSSFDHNLAVTSSGALYSWGNNDAGQLGVGSGAPYECNPQHVNYSGSGVCSVKPSVDIQPQPCCVAIQDEGRITLEGTYTSGAGSINYTGQSLALTGPITLASGNHYLINCDVVCEYDASITINSGARLYIQSGSHLYACGDMWQGIDAKTGSRIYVQSSSLIEDAEVAVDVEYGALYNINTAIFNKNYTHFYKHMPSGSVGGLTGDYVIAKSKFLCQTTASIGGTPVHTTLLAPHAGQRTDVALLAVGVPKLLVGNTNAANANTVDNANWGIFDWTVGRVQVMHNILRDIGNGGVYAVYGPGAGGETIDIIDNDFLRMPYPIFCYDNSPTVETHITDNDIDFAGMSSPPTVMTGITYEEITPASGYDPVNPSNSEYNYVDISNNDILNAPCGIQLINLTGDQTAPTAKLYVGENYITHTKIPNDGQAGIKTANVRKGVFKANEVQHPSNSVNWWETGIRISDGYGNALTCNNTHDVGRGIFLDGTQTPDTRLILNEMQNNQIGLFLNWSVIGAQGASGDPRDNKWLGTSWNGSDPNTHVEGTDGTLSRFYVRPSVPYNPQYNNSNPSFAIPMTTTSGSWGGGCIYTSGASFKTDGALDEGTQDLLALLQLQEPESDREQSLQYLAQYNLYDRLVSDVELITANSEFESFVSERTSNNMGKLHQLVAGFRSARSNGADLENGMSLLHTVEPENRVEQTIKDVFSILYSHAADLTTIDVDDEIRLREIAQLCPLDFGFGVYTARSALLKLDTLPQHYFSECELVPSPEQISENKLEGAESDGQFTAYPNPNDGAFNLNYTLHEGETGTIEVFSAIGQLVYIGTLQPGSQSYRIVLEHMTAGIHQLRVSINGETRMSAKLVILN